VAVPNSITRSDASTLIPADYSNALLEAIFVQSAALSTFPRIPLGTKVTNFPLLGSLPTAGFVTENVDNADGIKPNSKVTWKNKQITAEEIACIVPIHENVIEDSTIDVWSQITPAIAEAMGVVVDGAIFYGTGKPSSWRNGLVTTANAAGNVIQHTGSTTVGSDLIGKLNDTYVAVEKDGNEVSHFFAGPRFKGKLRGLRATTGELIYSDLRGGSTGELYGASVDYVKNGVWNDAVGLGLAVDVSKIRVGVRSDMSYKVLDQASITSSDGTVINLAERDMVALRVKMRLGWEIADNVNRLASSPTSVALLTASAGNS
jgi:HK97 family phage major capsid protein